MGTLQIYTDDDDDDNDDDDVLSDNALYKCTLILTSGCHVICDVLEPAIEHWSSGSNRVCTSVVEKTVLRSPGADVAQVCRQSSTAHQHSLQSGTSASAGLSTPALWRGIAEITSMRYVCSYVFAVIVASAQCFQYLSLIKNCRNSWSITGMGKVRPAGRTRPSDSFCVARRQQQKRFNVLPFKKS